MQKRYWIQDLAPNGSFTDSIGLPIGTDWVDALTRLKSWRKLFPELKSQLIERTDVVLYPKPSTH